MKTWCAPFLLLTCTAVVGAVGEAGRQAPGPGAQGPEYVVFVASEAADKITRVQFQPSGGRIDREISTGIMPTEVDGPHGLAVARDRQFYYVTLGHGQPFGWVLKCSVADDRVLGQTMLGAFPASVDVTPDGNLLFAVNFNLHGDMVPSSVSVLVSCRPIRRHGCPGASAPATSRTCSATC